MLKLRKISLKNRNISAKTSFQSVLIHHVSFDKLHLSLIWAAAHCTIKRLMLLQVHLFLWNKLHWETASHFLTHVLFYSFKEPTLQTDIFLALWVTCCSWWVISWFVLMDVYPHVFIKVLKVFVLFFLVLIRLDEIGTWKSCTVFLQLCFLNIVIKRFPLWRELEGKVNKVLLIHLVRLRLVS